MVTDCIAIDHRIENLALTETLLKHKVDKGFVFSLIGEIQV